jgi:hypothetical protein
MAQKEAVYCHYSSRALQKDTMVKTKVKGMVTNIVFGIVADDESLLKGKLAPIAQVLTKI